MKILKIEIEKIRGIKKIILEPKGESMVIFGPNGSGKSAVVDAIDFLLAGKISRLEGEGTDVLSTKKHGPHIDHNVKEAIVKAQVAVPGTSEVINLERGMSTSTKLIFDEKFKDFILPALEVSSLGQHKLSRREILKYIMATAGTRASEVHALLNLEIIDKIRKSLVSVSNSLEKERAFASDSFDKTKTDIKILLALKAFSEENCLDKINENREILKAEEISELVPTELKKNITQPTGKGEEDVKNLDFLKQGIKALKDLMEDKNTLLEKESSFKNKIREFNKDFKLRKEIEHRKLIELGLNLIDNRNICPLCEKYWDAQELRDFLTNRLSESAKGSKRIEEIKSDSEKVRIEIIKYKNHLTNIETYYKLIDLKTYQTEITSVIEKLTTLSDKLLNPIEKYSETDSTIENLLRNKEIENLNTGIEDGISGLKYKVSPELTSWTILIKLEVFLQQYQGALVTFKKAERISKEANSVLAYFEKARDEILQNVFDKINDDFCCLYKELHGDDEKDFESSFIPKESELLFEVDFYKRGKFHPGAMHSEGHQDSMGFCLFLSLNKFLAKDKLSLIVLDDVVMSVDAQHRRNVCKALLKHFPEKQFIITTHDRIWANQLKTEKVVNIKNMFEFKWWSIETGPTTGKEEDFWKSIQEDLDKNNVPQAAWKLRRSGECFFNEACDLLRASVVFKNDGNWELGDYLPAAISQYKSLLRKAKEVANSWDDRVKIKELNEFEKKLTEAVNRSQLEQWVVNPNVHYNNWAEFQANDFKPVVEAFQELFNIFVCKNCGYIPSLLLSKDRKPESVKCNCGGINWNLHLKE